jgi:hypothetical protein
MAESAEAPAVKANEDDIRVIYAVTDGIASYQTRKKPTTSNALTE